MSPSVDIFFAGSALLAESPVYAPEPDALLWVDIAAGSAHRKSLVSGAHESLEFGQPVGAVLLREGQGLAYALRDGLAVSDGWGAPWRLVTATEREQPNKRMNDAKCDARGRVWVGTMAMNAAPGEGTLYRIAGHRDEPMVTGFTVPNGLCWNADDTQMYYIDSELQRVESFDFDAESGTLHRRRTLFAIAPSLGKPDGMTIDDSGCLWIAHFGGGAVRRYTLSGEVDRTIELPVSQVSSCAFGGRGYDQMFITTASIGLSDEARAREPLAGAVFVATPHARGFAAHRYRG